MNYSINNYECQETTKTGQKCKFKAQHNYENKLLCTKHLKCNKSKEDCPICFEPMKDKKVDACGKNHFYHVNCLAKCQKYGECPTCKENISLSTAAQINKEADDYRRNCLYLLPLNTHYSINILFDALIQNACVNQAFVSETNILSDCIMNYYNLPNIQRNNILTSLYYMINKIAKEEIYNINISIRDNQVFFN
jgi:hypothetical protein